MVAEADISAMRLALAQAEGALGQVWPNPAVGCVILKDGAQLGVGATQPGGRPHAEVVALAQAGAAARGATAVVTLEPCSHHGQTPPCADALVAAGIARAVVATVDPDPRVNARGVARMRAGGVEVELGVLEAEARALNAGFFTRLKAGRPLVTSLATPAPDQDGLLRSAEGGFSFSLSRSPERWWLGSAPSEAADRFIALAEPTPEALLAALGAAGITRAGVLTSDPLAAQLAALGLVDLMR